MAFSIKRVFEKAMVRRGWQPPSSTCGPLTMKHGLEMLHQNETSITTIIDMGAARGDWTRRTRKIFSRQHYLLCEPLPQRRESLKRLIQTDPERLHLATEAIGDHDGSVQFTIGDDLDGSGIYADGVGESVEVPLRKLDTVVSERGLEGPFFLKFDTHGYESMILDGATAVLSQTNVIVMEMYIYDISPTSSRFYQQCQQLDGLGFRPFYMVDFMTRPTDGSLWQMDVFFLRHENPIFADNNYSVN